ncbi:hypothetical protein K7X08_020541 [Anisodus acutangulus]|uniref:Uncharacterized protein n=1 Tax=Anisodus acutangulus TaxID=402998 RepID=A0A9Q1RFF7_9SOLA|nr:hypothetical protein K7X08_020541 [Anisodus acutangulus]
MDTKIVLRDLEKYTRIMRVIQIPRRITNPSLENLVNEEQNDGGELHEGLTFENDMDEHVNEIEDNQSGDGLIIENVDNIGEAHDNDDGDGYEIIHSESDGLNEEPN